MTHVDDSDFVLDGGREDGPDVAAVEGEEVADPRPLQSQRYQLASVAGVAQVLIAQGMAGVLKAA